MAETIGAKCKRLQGEMIEANEELQKFLEEFEVEIHEQLVKFRKSYGIDVRRMEVSPNGSVSITDWKPAE